MTRLSLLALLLLASGCGGDSHSATYGAKPTAGGTYSAPSDEDAGLQSSDIVGTWDLNTFIDSDEVAELSDDPIPPGVEIDMTVTGSSTYHVAERYDTDAEIVLRVRQAGEEIPLTFLVRQTGTWELVGDVLSETVVSGNVTALDEITQAVLDSDPEFAAFITPLSGETTSSRIHSATASTLDVEELGSSLRFTLRRES